MMLVIGGLNGFVGSNTTEALVNLGKDCVVTRHTSTDVPRFLQKHIDHRHVLDVQEIHFIFRMSKEYVLKVRGVSGHSGMDES